MSTYLDSLKALQGLSVVPRVFLMRCAADKFALRWSKRAAVSSLDLVQGRKRSRRAPSGPGGLCQQLARGHHGNPKYSPVEGSEKTYVLVNKTITNY
jgi:hypothetical protein